MSFTPTVWAPGDVVTTAKLNAIETAVGEFDMGYIPNTWTDGDILSAAKMNRLEEAVANAGNFSTAEMRIVFTSGEYISARCTYIDPVDGLIASNSLVEGTHIIPLYNNSVTMSMTFLDTPTLSGSVTAGEYGTYIITGDCTLTGRANGIM